MMAPTISQKPVTNRAFRAGRLLFNLFDPRMYLHGLRLLNYYNYTHVAQRRRLVLGRNVAISPNVVFAHAERIEIGDNAHLGARSMLWAGPAAGHIKIGKNLLLGPGVLMTAANYRFNDGSPVAEQLMEERSIVIGDDVWIGANATILPGVEIGNGAIIGAGAVVRTTVPADAIVAGVPARVVGHRSIQDLPNDQTRLRHHSSPQRSHPPEALSERPF
jgi:acetyltransferase-like isoleucine patch superfamily enzyme